METRPRTTCDEIELRLAPYADGEDRHVDRAAVERHLTQCPICRERARAEQVARTVLQARRSALVVSAPAGLRARCQPQGARRPPVLRWAPVSLAATLVLAVGAAFLYTLDHGAEALAASIAADHLKCFTFADTSRTADPAAIAADWERNRGWRIKVLGSLPAERLRLLGVRRCLSTEGQTAHLMYMCDGRPLSVFVWRRPDVRARDVEVLGHRAVIWSSTDRMYAVVGTESAERMARVAASVRQMGQ